MVHHPPRGRGASPPRAGYLYVRPHVLSIPPLSLLAQVAVGAFGLLSLVGACLIARFGGFSSESGTTFVSGGPALAMALIQAAGAWVSFSALLGQYGSKRRAYLLSLLLVTAAPLAVLAAR